MCAWGHESGRNDLKEDENLDNEIHAGGGTNGRGKKEIISWGRGMEEGSGSKGKCMPDP